jgi:aspartate racemase
VVQNSVSIPVLHIADPLGKAIKREGFHKVGLLGTKTTMEENFYQKRLKEKFNIDVLIPPKAEREMVDKIIFNELVTGKIKKYSREIYYSIMYELIEQGAEGIVLGCTEIPLLIEQKDVRIPLFDTTKFHAEAAVEFALDE